MYDNKNIKSLISPVTCMNKIGRITDHRSIYPQSLAMLPPAAGALWLMETTCEPLNPNITGAGHFFVFHSIQSNWKGRSRLFLYQLSDYGKICEL